MPTADWAELGSWLRSIARPWHEGLSEPARRFVTSPEPRKIALCGRRAGKTRAVLAWLLDGAAEDPGGLSVFIGVSRSSAHMILGPGLAALRHLGVGLTERERDGQLGVEAANGHRVWIAGCNDSADLEKFRGLAIKRAAVDEAASIGPLGELVEDVLTPALLDKRGRLALVGTPGPIPAGYFYRASTGDDAMQWPTFAWTVLENPHIPHAAEWLRDRSRANGWDAHHPTYQREWLGHWVRDESALVYPYDPGRNGWDGTRPDGQWRTVLGVDLGSTDATAFVLVASRAGYPDVYVERVWQRTGLTPSGVAAHLEDWRERYRPTAIVVDAGGLGAGYVREMQERWHLPVAAAEKRDKLAFVDGLRGELLAGTLRVVPRECAPLLAEWSRLTYSDDRTEIPDGQADHCADACLYAWRAARQWYRPEREPPAQGTPAWWEAERLRLRDETKRAAVAQARRASGRRR